MKPQPGISRPSSFLAHLIVAALFLVGIGAAFAARAPYLLNSDALYLPSLFSSIRSGQDLRLFSFPPSPYLFPDLLIHFLCVVLAPSLIWAAVFVAVLQVALFCLAALRLGKHIGIELSGAEITFILAPFAAWLFVESQFDFPIFMMSLLSAHHFGIVLLTLWSLCALFSRQKLLFAVCVALGVISDPLFLPLFVVPIACALFLTNLEIADRKTSLKPALLAASLLGALAYYCLRHFFYFVTLPPTDASRLSAMAQAARELSSDLLQDPLLIPAYAFGVLASVGALLKRPTANIKLLCTTLLLLVAASFLAPILLAFYRNGAERYLMPGAILSALTGQLIAARSLQGRKVYLSFVGAAYVVAAVPFLPYKAMSLSSSELVPPIVRCLDARLSDLSAKRGLGDYWLAKQVSYLSSVGLKVDEVRSDFAPFDHLNNLEQFLNPATGKGWDYDFIIMRRLDVGRATELFGKPDFSFLCGRSAIWVYRAPRHLDDLEREVQARIAELSAGKKF